MKIKKEFIILAVIIVVLAGYLIFNANSKGEINYTLPKLSKLDEGALTKIEVSSASGVYTLLYDDQDEFWRLFPQKYPVDANKSDKMVEQITDLSLTTLISDKQAYAKYGLDAATKVSVTAYQGDDVVRNIDIGKVADVTNHTFVKLADDPNIYDINLNIRDTFIHTVDDLRDKVVLKVDKDSVREISIAFGDEDYTLVKTVIPPDPEEEDAVEKTEWKIDGQDEFVDAYQVNTMLSTLANLLCDKYVPDNEMVDFSEPYYSLVIQADKEYKLYMMPAQGEDKMHPATSSENDYQFYLMDWKGERLMKTLADMRGDD